MFTILVQKIYYEIDSIFVYGVAYRFHEIFAEIYPGFKPFNVKMETCSAASTDGWEREFVEIDGERRGSGFMDFEIRYNRKLCFVEIRKLRFEIRYNRKLYFENKLMTNNLYLSSP